MLFAAFERVGLHNDGSNTFADHLVRKLMSDHLNNQQIQTYFVGNDALKFVT